MSLPVIAQDKANHWVYGSLIASIGTFIAGPVVGLIACLTFALLKELNDLVLKKGTPEVQDVVATVAGGATVVLPIILS